MSFLVHFKTGTQLIRTTARFQIHGEKNLLEMLFYLFFIFALHMRNTVGKVMQ